MEYSKEYVGENLSRLRALCPKTIKVKYNLSMTLDQDEHFTSLMNENLPETRI